MNYTHDAMKFVIQGENALSPVLRQVRKDYDKAVTSLERSNKKLYDTVSKGLEVASELFHDLDKLPAQAKKSINKVMKVVGGMKKISVPITIQTGGSSGGSSGTTDAQLWVRGALKELSRGPSKQYFNAMLKGVMKNLPQFAEGGYVPSSNLPKGLRMGKDGTLIMASAGELVVPAKAAKEIMELAQSVDKMRAAMDETAGKYDIGKAAVGDSLEHFSAKLSQRLLELEKRAGGASKAVTTLSSAESKAAETAGKMAEVQDKKVTKALKNSTVATADYDSKLKDMQQTIDNLNHRLDSINTDTKYLGLSHAFSALQGVPGQFNSALEGVGAGQGAFTSYGQYIDEANRYLLLPKRTDVLKLQSNLLGKAQGMNIPQQQLGAAFLGLTQTGFRGNDLMNLSPFAAQMGLITQMSPQEMARYIYRSKTQNGFGYNQQQMKDILLQQVQASRVGTGVDFHQIASESEAFRTAANPLMVGFNSPARSAKLEKGAAQLSAFMHMNNLGDMSQSLLTDLAMGYQNDPHALQRLNVRGINSSAVSTFIRTGDISGVVSGLGAGGSKLRSYGRNAHAIAGAAGMELSPTDVASMMSLGGGNAQRKLAELRGMALPSGAIDSTASQFTDSAQSFGQQIENHIQNALKWAGLDKLYGAMHEIGGVQRWLALGYLGVPLARGVGSAGRSILRGIPRIGSGIASVLKRRKSATSVISSVESAAEELSGAGGFGKAASAAWGPLGILSMGAADMGRIVATGGAIALVIMGIGKAAAYAAPAIEASSKGMVSVIRAIGGMTDDKTALDMGQVEKTGRNIHAVGQVMGDLKTMIIDYNKAAGMSIASGIVDAFISDARAFFPFTTSLVLGDPNGNAANSPVVNSILHGVAQSQIIIKELSRASLGDSATVAKSIKPTLDSLATVMYQLHNFMYNVVQSGKDAQGLESSFLDKIKGVDGGLNALTSMSPHIKTFAIMSVNDYADVATKLDDKTLENAKLGIGKAADLISAMEPFFAHSVDLGNSAKGLERSNWDWIKGLPGGMTALSDVAKSLPLDLQVFNAKFAKFHTTFNPDSIKGVNDAGLLVAGLEPFYEHINKIGETSKVLQADTLKPLTDARTGVFNWLYATSSDFLSLSQHDPYKNKDATLGAFGTSLQMVSEYGRLLDAIDVVGTKHTSSLTLTKTLAKVNEAVGPLLHELSSNFFFSPDVKKSISVQVEASMEDKQQVVLLQQMVKLLGEMLAIQERGGTIPPEMISMAKRAGNPNVYMEQNPVLY